MKFVKYNVCRADYIVSDDMGAEREARSLCDRHSGIGGCGIVFVGQNPFRARVFRPDGRACAFDASALACAAAYLCEKCGTPKVSMISCGEITEAELLSCGEVSLSLPKIKSDSMRRRRADIARPVEYVKLSVGSSMRAVCLTDDIFGAILFGQGEALSKYLSSSTAYDVDLARLCADGSIEVKSYERGAGYVTSACGAYAAKYVLAALNARNGGAQIKTDSGRMSVVLGEKPTAKMTVSKILSGEIG